MVYQWRRAASRQAEPAFVLAVVIDAPPGQACKPVAAALATATIKPDEAKVNTTYFDLAKVPTYDWGGMLTDLRR